MKKGQNQKISVENLFWSESMQNISKRVLHQKSRNHKIVPGRFCVELCRFSAKIVKKDQVKKYVKIFFGSESNQNVSKGIINRKSRNRKFFPCNFFHWTQSFLGQNGENDELMTVKIFWPESVQNVAKTFFKPKNSN